MLGFISLILWIPLLRFKDAILTIATLFRLKSLPEMDGSGSGDLLVMKYDDRPTAAETAEMCAICLTEFVGEDSVSELTNCGHVFHSDCIEKWLVKNRFTCPLCRRVVVFNIEIPRHESKPFRFVVPDDDPSCLYYFLQ